MSIFVGYVASLSKSSCLALLWQIGSPVSDDSSTFIYVDSRIIPSAGISSPFSTITMSSTTISLFATVVTFPSLMTLTGSWSLTTLRRANSLSALYSNRKDSPVARMMAINIPIGSRKLSVLPLSCKYSYRLMHADSAPATRSIMMRGSLNFSRYLFHSGVVLGCVRILHPCSRRFLSTSASVNPSLES